MRVCQCVLAKKKNSLGGNLYSITLILSLRLYLRHCVYVSVGALAYVRTLVQISTNISQRVLEKIKERNLEQKRER